MTMSKSDLEGYVQEAAEAGFAIAVTKTNVVWRDPMTSAFDGARVWNGFLGSSHKAQCIEAMKCAARAAFDHKHMAEIPPDSVRQASVVACGALIDLPELKTQFSALNEGAADQLNGFLLAVYDEAFRITPRATPTPWGWYVAGGVAALAAAGGTAWYFNVLPRGYNRADTGWPTLPGRPMRSLPAHNPVKREYGSEFVPKGQIKILVGRMSVGEPDDTVRENIESIARQSKTPQGGPWPDYFVKMCGDYAVKVHRKNQKLYNDVMSGNIGSGRRRRKSNPAKGFGRGR